MSQITSEGLFSKTKLFFQDTGGDGRPVVLIHGWPLSSDSWSEQIPAFHDAGYRVIAYDRRGFGRSDKPKASLYTYGTLADDLNSLLEELELRDVTLVGFSMGGGEVARFLAAHGDSRVHSVVFAASVTPYMMKTPGNPDGPLTLAEATRMTAGLTANQEKFYDDFTTQFFSVGGDLKVTEDQRQEALALTEQADKNAALQCMAAFGNTDFRDDLKTVKVPALVIHGDGDGTVPLEGSGRRTHEALAGSELVVVHGAPHGLNVSHAEQFNHAVLEFLAR
jgi:pimeloyl-ACP methyl ester carboxylesterase